MKSDLALLRNVRSGRTPGFTLRAAPPTWTSSFSSVLPQIWVLPKTLFYRTIEALLKYSQHPDSLITQIGEFFIENGAVLIRNKAEF